MRRKRENGFTLIEMMVVMAIVAIMSLAILNAPAAYSRLKLGTYDNEVLAKINYYKNFAQNQNEKIIVAFSLNDITFKVESSGNIIETITLDKPYAVSVPSSQLEIMDDGTFNVTGNFVITLAYIGNTRQLSVNKFSITNN